MVLQSGKAIKDARMRIFKLLDSYLLGEQLHLTYIFILTLLGMFFGTNEIRSIIRQIVEVGMPAKIAIYIMAMRIPEGIVECLPAAVLMATLLVLHRMCLDSEIIALQACGISLRRILGVVLAAGLICSLVSFAISEFVVPCGKRATWGLMAASISASDLPILKATACEIQKEYDEKGVCQTRYMFVGSQHGKQLSNVTVLMTADDEVTAVMNAARGTYKRGKWVLYEGRMYKLKEQKGESFACFGKLEIASNREMAKVYEESINDPIEFDTLSLKKYIDTHWGNNAPAYALVHYYKRYSRPLACFFIILAAAPMALSGRRTRTWRGMAYAGIILTIYYSLVSSISGLAENGRMLPLLAAWLPNIVVGTLGLTILTYKTRHA